MEEDTRRLRGIARDRPPSFYVPLEEARTGHDVLRSVALVVATLLMLLVIVHILFFDVMGASLIRALTDDGGFSGHR